MTVKILSTMIKRLLLLTIFIPFHLCVAFAQSATIYEEIISVPTYYFSDPNPVPILAENPKIYPYFKFEGYEHQSTMKDWKVISMENDYIQLWVLPEMGGKVWGAVEKSTGEEFLYKNEVMKFRNLAMRGPWTSGGLEFNFGIIGHSPDTATPVDYKIRNNKDGSVTCIVGTMDVAARTRWWVEITLQPEKAYFETQASWYNGTPLNQSYYNWMTAAAAVADDLEFIYPGDQELSHGGEVHPWPIDEEGRNLAFYRNNNFGPAKSKHIVGEYCDIFGGYYHDKKFGFGHWGLYEEIPGQKLWLWSLSRFGGIWEDLLTDDDGQYMEFQAGRLFNQYFPGETNPISQANFDPLVMDRWRELWFPFKDIGGMVAASEYGVLNVREDESELYVGLNALQKINHELKVIVNGKQAFGRKLNLQPMEVFSTTIPVMATDRISVVVEDADLSYQNDPGRLQIDRPFQTDEDIRLSPTEKLYNDAWEDMKFRLYGESYNKFFKLLEMDPYHRAGLVRMAELEYRKTDYKKALEYANTVLQMDTYDGGANYFAGISYRALNDKVNALESLGWAARDVKYRSASHAQMAEIYLSMENFTKATIYANKALDYNTYNLAARKVLAIIHRVKKNSTLFTKQIEDISEIEPLNHFVVAERQFMHHDGNLNEELLQSIHNEFVAETILELALEYHHLGRTEEAIQVLKTKVDDPKNKLWLAWWLKDFDVAASNKLLSEVADSSIEFVFPYRVETVTVLEWSQVERASWKMDYLLAQNYLAVNQDEKGKKLLNNLGQIPDMATFYRFRAKILKEEGYDYQLENYQKALELDNGDWKIYEEFIQFYLENERYDEALVLSSEAAERYPHHHSIGLVHSKALLHTGHFQEVLDVLYNIKILPYEHARESRRVYEKAHLAVAQQYLTEDKNDKALEILKKSKEWPENIGVGKPYDPDERPQDYLLALTYKAMDLRKEKEDILNAIVNYTKENIETSSPNHIFGVWALVEQGKNSEAEKLLASVKMKAKDSTLSQLVAALHKKDKSALQQLRGKKILDKTEWELFVNFLKL